MLGNGIFTDAPELGSYKNLNAHCATRVKTLNDTGQLITAIRKDTKTYLTVHVKVLWRAMAGCFQ
jgi:hypothetical protein